MSATHGATKEHHEPGWYEIRIRGHLDNRRLAWFEGLTITREATGDTRLVGAVADQAALHGLLRKVRDLGMPLISVMEVAPKPSCGPDGSQETDHNRSNEETH